jgi:hypothetical protein
MKIFNEELEKHLLYNEIDEVLYKLPFFFVFWGISLVITAIFGGIIFNVVMALTNHSLSYCSQVVVLFFEVMVFIFIADKLINIIEKIIFKPSIPQSNLILIKLKNVTKQKDRVNLVKLWKHFNHNHPNNSIVLTQEQKDIELLRKLDADLVRFIENADDITIKLFNLDDFESYKQLYMKYIATEQKEEFLNKIQKLIGHHGSNQESHLVQQLHLLKNEVEEYDTDTTDYFEFKKWHQDTLDMLKLDKDNDMVKNNYQNIIQEINNNKED